MSAVRMCDRCGRIFPEGEEGSAVGTVTVMERNNRNGRVEQVQKSQDICALCGAGSGSVKPHLAIAGTDNLPQ